MKDSNETTGIGSIDLTADLSEEQQRAILQEPEFSTGIGERRDHDTGDVVGYFAVSMNFGKVVCEVDGNSPHEALTALAGELLVRLYKTEMHAVMMEQEVLQLRAKVEMLEPKSAKGRRRLGLPPRVNEELNKRPNVIAIPVRQPRGCHPPIDGVEL